MPSSRLCASWAAAAAARTVDAAERAHLAYAVRQIAEFGRESHRVEAPPAEPPDGQPIGVPDVCGTDDAGDEP